MYSHVIHSSFGYFLRIKGDTYDVRRGVYLVECEHVDAVDDRMPLVEFILMRQLPVGEHVIVVVEYVSERGHVGPEVELDPDAAVRLHVLEAPRHRGDLFGKVFEMGLLHLLVAALGAKLVVHRVGGGQRAHTVRLDAHKLLLLGDRVQVGIEFAAAEFVRNVVGLFGRTAAVNAQTRLQQQCQHNQFGGHHSSSSTRLYVT